MAVKVTSSEHLHARRAASVCSIHALAKVGLQPQISYLVPSIHPMIKVAPDGVPIHSIDFATWAASPAGDQAVIDGAKSMAMTVVDLWLQADLRERMNTAFAGRPAGVQVL